MQSTLPVEEQFIIGINLFLVVMLSMIIGLDRERRNRPAGLRTHMLVGIGAYLFTALSLHAFPNADTSRVASNIVTGVGFLGAGTIIKHRGNVHDLTTAASIWATAAVGMAIGTGGWLLAIMATVVIWIVLAVIRRFESEKASEAAKTPPEK